MSAAAPTPPGGTPRPVTRTPIWLKALVIVSLAFNVTIIGVVAGYQLRDGEVRTGSRQIDWIMRMVPEDRRDFTKAHFAAEQRALRETFLDRDAQMDEIFAAIRAEPFVPEALTAALSTRRDTAIRHRTIVHERLVSLLQQFEPEERQAFADTLSERMARWRERRATGLEKYGGEE